MMKGKEIDDLSALKMVDRSCVCLFSKKVVCLKFSQ